MTDFAGPLSVTERAFLVAHLSDDVSRLLLQAGHTADIDIKKVAAQLTARQKAVHKLPHWYANTDLVFPPPLSVEQASSEVAAHYKAGLVSGDELIDATGGMGVDAWAFSQRVKHIDYVEQNPLLAELAAYNLPRLNVLNTTITPGDGLEFIQKYAGRADWIYLDPARRDAGGGKVVGLVDYEPNVVDRLPALLAKADRILLKTSPLVDIDQTLRQLRRVDAVHIVAVQHEVKEVLFVIGQSTPELVTVPITAVDLAAGMGAAIFTFTRADERTAAVVLGNPQRYVCEPNAAVLKAGGFKLLAARFNLRKLAPHSHLYTADERPENFPGRVFELLAVIKPDRNELRALVPDLKANLTTRNFPQTVEMLRKKLELKEGGDVYILATTLATGDKRLLITRKPAK